MLQSSKTIVRWYYNTEEGAVHFFEPKYLVTRARPPEQKQAANTSYFVFLQSFSYYNAALCYHKEANLAVTGSGIEPLG